MSSWLTCIRVVGW